MEKIGLGQFVFFGIATIWVLLSIIAELANAYRSRSLSVLANRYTVGFTLSILTFLLRLTVVQIEADTPFYLIMFYLGIVDYSALYLLAVHAFVRGAYLLAILVGKRRSYETNWPMPKRLKMCSLAAWTLAVFIIIRVSGFVVAWFLDVIGK